MSKKPTPFVLTLCCEGVNHALCFKSRAKGHVALTTVLAAQRAYFSIANGESVGGDEFKIEDDYGAVVTGWGKHVKTMRLVDITEEHKSGMDLEIVKAQAALDFKEVVQKEHPGLMLARASAPGGLIRGAN